MSSQRVYKAVNPEKIRRCFTQPMMNLSRGESNNSSKVSPFSDKEKFLFSDPDKTSSKRKSSSDNEKLSKSKYKLVIVLPLILDRDCVPSKQPFSFQIDENQLSEFGFDLPFKAFFDEKRNYFIFNICEQKLTIQIIAIADNKSDLLKCFQSNVRQNPMWKNLKKIFSNWNLKVKLQYAPLTEEEDAPVQHVLGPKIIANIMSEFKRDVNLGAEKQIQIKKTRTEVNKQQVKSLKDC
ncbi:uncharacterized protein LOC128388735 [Panonychus citri]|uniref:uncharacterized protein LOC128388735 n=1 Tax=Panonychus citri TaxID=50023 RepID=UPI002306F20C|nr:uncharacterized protein LOC128388735 [Panonychus citri]